MGVYQDNNVAVADTVVNANGTAVKFEDGTMICYHEMTTPSNTANDTVWTLPVPFINPDWHAYIQVESSADYLIGTSFRPRTGSLSQLTFMTYSANGRVPIVTVDLFAIGQWK